MYSVCHCVSVTVRKEERKKEREREKAIMGSHESGIFETILFK